MLSVRDLTVEYTSGGYLVRPLDRFSLEAESGSLVVLLGPSGCGKSTFLSTLAGILQPASGSISVNGTEVTTLAGDALTEYRRRTVGVVFQAFNLVRSLSALDNVAAPMLAAGTSKPDARRRAAELLAQVDLTERAHHKPDHLSGGQQQRVAVARALALSPALVVADEPTAHLDYVQVEGILRLVRELAVPGRLLVVATHDERLLPLADQVVEMVPRFAEPARSQHLILEDGEVVFEEGSRGGLIYVIEEGTVEITRFDERRRPQAVATLGPGDHFGEMGPLFGLPRSATATVAEGTAVVTAYTAPQFRAVVGDDRLHGLLGRAGATVGAHLPRPPAPPVRRGTGRSGKAGAAPKATVARKVKSSPAKSPRPESSRSSGSASGAGAKKPAAKAGKKSAAKAKGKAKNTPAVKRTRPRKAGAAKAAGKPVSPATKSSPRKVGAAKPAAKAPKKPATAAKKAAGRKASAASPVRRSAKRPARRS